MDKLIRNRSNVTKSTITINIEDIKPICKIRKIGFSKNITKLSEIPYVDFLDRRM